ncbi:MAG: heat-inducible transcription repressor HrcA [Lachnospiraceae bacterium]|nr:heat-inducible transcription repressor HrcA [Lachnospiraceae bacterium]MBQ8318288.1 heat-inducible transcription repressor HrcA [Lachnospiraceae bacterium]MBR3600164.1 heat-inducible transcription repressor HrcA [Lachnospiraceae bacterium]
MELDERKKKILKAVIANYLETGEPVGSRTISKYTDLDLSSATIRNEMADLEELGYIYSPHPSAGRVPTDKGYRFYVDNLMEEKEEIEEVKSTLLERVDRMELMLKQVAKVLAYNTNYATMVTAPNYRKTVKFIQLSQVDLDNLLAVIVVEGNIIKNQMIPVNVPLDNEDVLKFNILLNTFLQGAALEDINLEMIQAMKKQAGEYDVILEHIFQGIVEAIHEANELEIYTSGATNILKYPEIGDISKTSELLEAFENKNELTNLLEKTVNNDGEEGIQVYIGDETPVQNMKDCSLVTATYKMPEGATGTIGIIGPKRMDYKKVVSTLKNLTIELDDIFKKGKGVNTDGD